MSHKLERVGKNFKIIRKIDEGAFAEIYEAINTKTNLEVAVKVEPVNTEHPQLIYECKLYRHLHNDSTVVNKGIPNIYYCTNEGTPLPTQATSTS
jgi:casein kinase 1